MKLKVLVGGALVLLLLGLWVFSQARLVVSPDAGVNAPVEPASPSYAVPLFVVLVAVSMGVGMTLGKLRQRRSLARFSTAMESASPDAMLAIIEVTGRGRQAAEVIPDFDAVLAHERAFVLALYGREDEARAALDSVDWSTRSLPVQAVRDSTEALINCLCSRRYTEALAMARAARGDATAPSAWRQTASFHQTVVNLAEALLGYRSLASEAKLPALQAPLLRLVTAYGLWVANDRAGNFERATQLRAILDAEAPHCEPLKSAPREAEVAES